MSLVETTATATAPITLQEACDQLAYFGSDRNDQIALHIAAATDWAERFTQRTLRQSVTRKLSLCEWWNGSLVLPWPPVASVTAVAYYDSDNADQTLASSNYEVVNDTEGTSRIEWSATATLPLIYDRQDAVRVTYVTGYAGSPPATVKQALLLMVQSFWNQDDGRDLERAEKCAKSLLGTVEWPRYA